MALDLYKQCPCGSGKKVKFCCSKDIVGELEKVMRAVEGEQRAAALDQVNKLIAARGPRSALLVLKANLELGLGDIDSATGTVSELCKGAPHNPVALALTAIIEVAKGEVETAVEKLQQSLEYIDDLMPATIYDAIGVMAEALLASGRVLAGRGHLMMQASLMPGKDNPAIKMLLQVNAAHQIPLLLKEDHRFATCPNDAPWRGEFAAAMRSAERGAWLAACESLTSLAEKVPGQPAIMRNVAILRGWLGQTEPAVAAWRQYAALDGVPLDDAVEAEALAQLLDQNKDPTIAELTLTYRVQDMDRLMERLLSDRRAAKIPIDLHELASDEQPPPRGAFYLLNMPVPESGVDLTLQATPTVLGEMYVYGKETDRDARLELVLERLPDIDGRKSAFAELVGDLASELQTEEVTGEVPTASAALAWRLHLPRDTPRERRVELVREQVREVMLRRWPEIPLPTLDGRCPREAAAEAPYRIRVLAAILLLELSSDLSAGGFDFDELRKELGLPTLALIDSHGEDVLTMPIVRLGRLDCGKLSDDDLLRVYRVAALKRHRTAIHRFAEEIIGRQSLRDRVDRGAVYQALVETSTDTAESLEYVEQACSEAQARGESPARWLLTELSIRLSRGEAEQSQQLFETIRTRHINEPGVAQSLRDLLVARGVLAPDGQPAASPSPPPAEPVASGAAPGDTKKLWTPGSAEASPPGEAKSKLWIPGNG